MKRLSLLVKTTPGAALASLAILFLFATPLLAQVPGTQTGSLNLARAGHTATRLADGKILIIGGENQSGPVGYSEIFDPGTNTFSLSGILVVPRSDHSATLLPNGRVLIIGGRDQTGLLKSTEIFDPQTNTFSPGPSLNIARAGHSATVLTDGRILLAGGDAGSVEIYDPATQKITLLTATMTTPRTLHGAVLLQNGKVFIAGGVSPDNTALNTAEIFDPQTMSFSATDVPMQTARTLPSLHVSPDGKVQVIGGDADFSMEMFDPAIGSFKGLASLPPTPELLSETLHTQSRAALINKAIAQNQKLQGLLTGDLLTLLDRSDHSLIEMPESNQTLVAGGIDSSGQMLTSAYVIRSSAASVTTDWLDYPPGTTVKITGSGWQANETVSLILHEMPDAYPDIRLSSVADASGNFINTDFSPVPIDVGRTFMLTAVGQSSGFTAQTIFKDATPTRIQTSSMSPSTGACGSTITASATLEYKISNPNNWGGLSGKTVSFTLGAATGSGTTNASGVATASLTVPAGATSLVASFAGDGTYNAVSSNIAFTVTGSCIAPTTLTVAPATGIYGGMVNLSATLTKTSDSSPVSGKSISFTLNGTSVGSATTNASGVATLSGVSLSGINAATYPSGVGASFAGDSSYGPSSGTAQLTINKAQPAFSGLTGGTTTYGSTTKTTLSGTIKAGTLIPTGSVSITVNSVTQSAAINTTTGNFSFDFDTSAWNANTSGYQISYSYTETTNFLAAGPDTTQKLVVNKAQPAFTNLIGGTTTYGSTTPTTLSGTIKAGTLIPPGSVSITVNGVTQSAAINTTTGNFSFDFNTSAWNANTTGYQISYSYAETTNFLAAGPDTTQKLVVNKATLIVTADDPPSRQYSDRNPTFTASYSGFKKGEKLETSGVSGSPSLTTTADGASSPGTYTITAALGTLEAQNYTFAFVNGKLTVTKEDATVWFDPNNPAAKQVSGSPLAAGQLSLTVFVQEKQPDQPSETAAAGNINNAGLTVTLTPLSGGGSILLSCRTTDAGPGYSAKTFTCTNSSSLNVNTYDVTASVNGNYYTAPEAYDGFTVYDPSLGFATGGGWFYWPGSTDKTNFGFTMKYNKSGTNPQGSLLVVRHHADGTISRIKSNLLEGFAIQNDANTNNGCGIATFGGKATYMTWNPSLGAYVNNGGNYFSAYAEDCNEPGTGFDQFWVRSVGDLVMGKDDGTNAITPITLNGGNIAVPHGGNGTK